MFCANVTDGNGVFAYPCVHVMKPAPPVSAVDDRYTGVFNLPRVVNASEGLLANDRSYNSSAAVSLTITNITVDLAPSMGNLTQLDFQTGAFVFTPAMAISPARCGSKQARCGHPTCEHQQPSHV